jgi:septum formation topological specificity factor MinE
MSNFFDRMFGRKSEGSSSKAKDRLQFVLVHDRINLPPETTARNERRNPSCYL